LGKISNILKDKSQEQLWRLFINGDMHAFNLIYSNHYQMLHNFGIKFLPPSEIEDAIHDTFLNLLNYKKSLAEVNNVKAYLFKCLRNQIFKIKKLSKLEFSLIEGTIQSEVETHDKEKALIELKKIIKQLSPREREIVYLKYFQHFNNKEIADLLDIKYQTVRNILANAIIKLRTLGEDIIPLLFMLFK